jgi:hypothetical protein
MKTNSRRLWVTAIIASLILMVFIGGCKKDEYVEIPGVCPTVSSTNPTNGATNVPPDQVITATFNEEMNPETINQSSFTLTGGLKSGVAVAGTLTYNNTNATLSFVPTVPLASNTTYTGTVKTTIRDLKGNGLQTNYVWTFSTGVVLSPTVISTDPTNLTTGVFLNKVVTASFSIAMDPATITSSTFTLKQGTTTVAGTITYTGITASFTPASALTPGTVYTGTITTGAKNVAGTPIENNYVWTFTTGSNIGPSVISTDPSNNAAGVTLDKVVTATFSVPMDPLTLTTSTFTVKQGLTTLAGTVSYTGSTASFTLSGELLPNTLYVCTITTGAKNVAGTALTENYVWSFTTGSFTTPTVISTDPTNNATNVVLSKRVTATFSVPMDPLTLTATTFILRNGTTLVTGAISYIGSTVTFIPTVDLLPGILYTATITTGAMNTAGIALAANYVWSFTTLTAASAPIVISTDPADKVTNVDLLKTVAATFSMPMNPLTLTASSFTVKNGTIPIAGTITCTGSTASFNPLSTLLPNTIYTCTITTAAQSVAGTAMAADYVWNFTTEPVATPLVISTDPADNATNVDLLKTVTASFNMAMNPLTINAASFTILHGTIPIGGIITYSGTTASFAPLSTLLANTVYTCTVTTSAQNATGVAMASDYVWTFTTAATVVAPVVLTTEPANNATGVSLDKTVTATFDMPMDPLTISTSTFTLKQGLTSVDGVVSYTGTMASFNPNNNLVSGAIYTATITTGAQNLAGVPLVNDYVWSFTTNTTVTPPNVDLGSASIFGAFGGNAGVTNQGINTVINGAIATTAASTLITGFHNGMTGDVYTETPLNQGLVTNGIFTAPPIPRNSNLLCYCYPRLT